MSNQLIWLATRNPVGNIILLYVWILWLYKPPEEEL